MVEKKKIIIFRLSSIGLLLVPLALTIWFLIIFATTDAKSFGLHIFASAVLAFFISFQIFLLIKNFKKQPIIYNIAFNENKTINKTPLIALSIIGGVCLGGLIAAVIVYFLKTEVQFRMACLFIISVMLFAIFNIISYMIFIPLFKEKKFKIEDLLK